MLPVEPPFKIYTGTDGKALDRGYINLGEQNENPITAPVTVYWDQELTQPAAQPLRTVNGYIVRAGTPANIFVDGDYSILVRDSKGRQVFYGRDSQDFNIGSIILIALGLPGGAANIGGGAQVVSTIAGLRLLKKTKPSKSAIVTGYWAEGDGGGGQYYLDVSDNVSTDNGGTVIVAADGGRWKLQHTGSVNIKQFGMLADWDGATGTDNGPKFLAMIADEDVTTITGALGSYWFGFITGDTVAFPITRDIDIDWCNADLVCTGDNTGAFASTVFCRFTDCHTLMRNYTFEDTAFLFAGPSRGVMPILILADAEDTYGHSIGPCRVKKGQSLITAASLNPMTARSRKISLVGACSGDQVYYGINLANNGDSVDGSFRVNESNRALFIYGVDGCDVEFTAEFGQPASANMLISNSGTGYPMTSNIKVRAKYNVLNGPFVIADQPTANGSGVYENLDIVVMFESLGTNITASDPIIRIGAYAVDGTLYTVEKTVSTANISIDMRVNAAIGNLDVPIQVYTPSPNYGLLILTKESQYNRFYLFPQNAAGAYMGPVLEVDGRVFRSVSGDLTAATAVVVLPSKYLSPVNRNTEITGNLRVQARNGVGGGVYTIREYLIIGQLNSLGEFTFIQSSLTGDNSTGGINPIFTIDGVAGGLRVSSTLYTNAFAQLTASFSSL